jgi:hypothetical protein
MRARGSELCCGDDSGARRPSPTDAGEEKAAIVVVIVGIPRAKWEETLAIWKDEMNSFFYLKTKQGKEGKRKKKKYISAHSFLFFSFLLRGFQKQG